MDIIKHLETVRGDLTFVDQEHARRIVELVNHRVCRLLTPHIIDLMWRQPAEQQVVFCPLDRTTFDITNRGGPGWFYVPEDAHSQMGVQTGVWTWVYDNAKPVWLENITKAPYRMDGMFRFLTKPIVNQETGVEIPQRYLSFFRGTDSMIVIPLVVENSVRGIYSIEIPSSRVLSKWSFETIKRLTVPIADLLREVDNLHLRREETRRVIKVFEELVFRSEVPLTDVGMQIFLCHSKKDKLKAWDLYCRLKEDGFRPWLDEKDLLPGQVWEKEIAKAIKRSDIFLVCLSQNATGAGFIHKEIKYALDQADQQPEGTIFIIPLKLEECPVPDRLSELQWVNYSDVDGYDKLLEALRSHAVT